MNRTAEDFLAGKRVLVAGATSGMGRAVALRTAASGARVWLLGRDERRLADVEAAAREAGAAETRGIHADVTDAEALRVAFDDSDAGEVDILVNSIGMNVRDRAFEVLTSDTWHAMIRANLDAAFNLARLALPGMRARGDGLIINIASTAARRADKSGAAYQATKAGVVAMTHAIMEEEREHGVRLTAVLPGMTNTPLLDDRPVPVSEETRRAALQPDDIAATCLYVMQLPPTAHVAEIMLQPAKG